MAMFDGNQKPQFQSPFDVSRLTFPEIESHIQKIPALILPLGGCEPFSSFGTLGGSAAVAEALALALSAKTAILTAPALPYGCSTPYASFGGTGGVKPRTLANILCESMRMWHFQGINAILIIDPLRHNQEAVEFAKRRCSLSHPGLTVNVFSLEHDPGLRLVMARKAGGEEPERGEFAMLSMAAWIDSGLVRLPPERTGGERYATGERLRTWRKRGADPEQFRKLAPGCSCSDFARRYDPAIGQALFGYILEILEKNAATMIVPHHP